MSKSWFQILVAGLTVTFMSMGCDLTRAYPDEIQGKQESQASDATMQSDANLDSGEAERRQSVTEHAEMVLKYAEEGVDFAQYHTATYYLTGYGVEYDPVQAFKWFRKASEQGNYKAQYCLGWCYHYGLGVEKDLAKAVEWYRIAAQNSSPYAQYALGWCYMKGDGVEKDPSQAVEWFYKAAQNRLHVPGTALEADSVQATRVPAQTILGECYLFGIGVEKDPVKAFEWFQKASAGYVPPQRSLEVLFVQGIDQKAPVQKIDMLRKAAEQGVSFALQRLGSCYLYGIGVEKDTAKAEEYFQKAKAQRP